MTAARRPSALEAAFEYNWRALGYPANVWQREYRFAPPRLFRFDFANLDSGIAVELDGGTWTGGRHVTGAGFARDAVKNNLAMLHDWRVFHLTADMLALDPAHHLGQIAEALGLDVRGGDNGD